ncbi:MAG: hypothetical protein M1837_004158 [Sclerophora amabilis]|nr:MAG: hypothetical protein M1837_004158 [Sclerophora amabilis]
MAALPPREIVTADNYGPAVSVITWVLLVSMIFSVCVKVALKLLAARTLNADDGILILAMAISIGQSIAASIQIENGVGQHQGHLSTSQIDTFEKAGYASNLLFISSLAISKLSTLCLLLQITPIALHRRLALALGAAIITWTVTSLFASAFQCRLPSPWEMLGTRCFDQISFWTYYGVLNIVTETGLIVLPIYSVWSVHLKRKDKAVTIGCFAVRLIVIGAILPQLILLHRLRTSTDVTFDGWSYYLCTQCVQNLSVVAVCVPYIKNALLGLESGMIQTGDFHLRKISSPSMPNDQHLPPSDQRHQQPLASPRQPKDTFARGQPLKPKQEDERMNRSQFDADNTAFVSESTAENGDGDGESQSSLAKIMRSTEWKIEYGTPEDTV